MKTKISKRIAFLVSGGPGSAMDIRARGLCKYLGSDWSIKILHRVGNRGWGTWNFIKDLLHWKPHRVYVLDTQVDGVIAAFCFQLCSGVGFILDTGDVITELGRVLGRRGLALAATWCLEYFGMRLARSLVVRGRGHQDLLTKSGIHSVWIPDGVEVDDFASLTPRYRMLDDPLVIGLMGSCTWIESKKTCYGMELVEVVAALQGKLPCTVRGLMVGGGTGLPKIKKHAEQLGVSGEIDFVGSIKYSELPKKLQQFDIALSTQSNDLIGQVRTTGKLPLYLAAGCFVLASRVGEAARILPTEMLVDYYGKEDKIDVLVSRIVSIVKEGKLKCSEQDSIKIAKAFFEYKLLHMQIKSLL